MDAVEYLKTLKRICKEHNPMCPDCPAFPLCGASGDYIRFATPEKITKAVEDVESWRKEHPTKTRQSEFLKMFPNAILNDGTPHTPPIKPCLLEPLFLAAKCENPDSCLACRRKFWTEEIE